MVGLRKFAELLVSMGKCQARIRRICKKGEFPFLTASQESHGFSRKSSKATQGIHPNFY